MHKASRLLVAAAAVHAAVALPLLFAPQEVAATLAGGAVSPATSLLAELLGAALFGLAAIDWMSRHTLVGGIYGRPLVVANLVQAFAAAMALGRAVLDGNGSPVVLATLLAYAALAVAFGSRLFATPATVARG